MTWRIPAAFEIPSLRIQAQRMILQEGGIKEPKIMLIALPYQILHQDPFRTPSFGARMSPIV